MESTQKPNDRGADNAINERLAKIGSKLMVLSGKGGVGKSTVAVNLAYALHRRGYRVGILDADIHGPNIPKMLGIEDAKPVSDPEGIDPIELSTGTGVIKVMSLAFFIDRDSPVIWRGPMKMTLLRQFLSDVNWGGLDYLVIDLPPGTGDEALSVAQLIPDVTGSVIVSTPQDVALLDSGRSIEFARKLNINVLGVIENMSGLKCPHCGEHIDLFKTGGVEKAAGEMNVGFLGKIPLDPLIVRGGDDGRPFIVAHPDSEAAKAFGGIVDGILGMRESPDRDADNQRDSMEFRILVEDAAMDEKFEAEHGLSIYFESDGRKILVDTGLSGMYLRNAAKLGIDISDIDHLVLSHGHYDHAGGLPSHPLKDKTRIIAHPEYGRQRFDGDRYLGIPKGLERMRVETSSTPVKLTDNVYFLGEIPGERKHPLGEYLTDGERRTDYIPDDSGVAILHEGRLIVISGCAHSGIVNMTSYAKNLFDTIKPGQVKEITIVGGFHLTSYNPQELDNAVSGLRELGVTATYPGHCTGGEGVKRLLREFSGESLQAGKVLKI